MTELESHLVWNFGRLTRPVYVKTRLLVLLNIKDLWLGRVVDLEYTRKISRVRYKMRSYRYDEGENMDGGVVKEAQGSK